MLSSSRIYLLAAAVAALCSTAMGAALPPDSPVVLCTPERETRLVDDPKPHQKYKYVQVTSGVTCDSQGGCEGGAQTVKGTSTEWSVSVTGPRGWISGGFAVSTYEESGEVQTCPADENDRPCVWYRFAHTAYTVQDWYKPCTSLGHGDWEKSGDEYVMASPNSDSKGSGAICARNAQCKSKGHYFWPETPERVDGGPRDFPYSGEVENSMLWPPENSMEFGDQCRTEIFWAARLTMCDK
ncbi:uncharacterized protein DNG_09273 [Cephalotrichum gorgonifer]|uniref:Secreted protein n=1 Tax=Cephalotrichum gorgonifer TaxID=2041049 RepID=A0AAE8SZ94_9PEZI|nr:uncharacterized protein DNG_09273 [Cephalotrichum gorgonifer]